MPLGKSGPELEQPSPVAQGSGITVMSIVWVCNGWRFAGSKFVRAYVSIFSISKMKSIKSYNSENLFAF